MKPIVRRGLGLLLIIAMGAIMLTSSRLSRGMRRDVTCQSGIRLTVRDSAERQFVSLYDVERWMDREYHAYVGLPLDSLDLGRIESIIGSKSAVRDCQAWITDDGIIHVTISQREPVVRFQDSHNGYYADESGFIFPLHSSCSVMVPIVDGNLPLNLPRGFKGMVEDEDGRLWLSRILAMTDLMRGSVWGNNISQIHVQPDGDLILYPATGRETILFGPPVRIAEKFSLLEKYYRNILPEKGEGYYSKVDLRYRGQIICKR